MVFKDTSAKFRSTQAMTLVELLVAGAIAAVLSTAICTSLVYSSRSLVGLSNYIEMDSNSRNSLDNLTSDMRQLGTITDLATNDTSAELRGTLWTNSAIEITYYWNKETGHLTRSCTGEPPKTLLTDCEVLAFALFQRNPSAGWTLVPTITPTTTKYVQVSWTCRKSIGSTQNNLWNTETVQTAGIMLRNHH